jgi:hypothetical protein
MDKKMTPKQKDLAGMSGDKGKITRGDIIKAAQRNQMKKGNNMKAKKK